MVTNKQAVAFRDEVADLISAVNKTNTFGATLTRQDSFLIVRESVVIHVVSIGVSLDWVLCHNEEMIKSYFRKNLKAESLMVEVIPLPTKPKEP